MKTVVMQKWDESEFGWGIRPDGCSLHKVSTDVEKYVQEYWDRMPEAVPHEYSRPGSGPTVIEISDELYEKVASSKNGIRLWQWDMREHNLT